MSVDRCWSRLVSCVRGLMYSPEQIIAQLQDSDAIFIPMHCNKSEFIGTYGEPVTNYYVQVHVGIPEQHFRCRFDLALDDCYLVKFRRKHDPTTATTESNLNHEPGYKTNMSKTKKTCRLDANQTLEYEGCLFEGKLVSDCVSFREDPRISVSTKASDRFMLAKPVAFRHRFLCAKTCNEPRFLKQPIEGSFGLGPLKKSPQAGCKNMIWRMKRLQFIKESIFSMWFVPNPSTSGSGSRKDCCGHLILGGVGKSFYEPPVYWCKSSRFRWSVNIQAIHLGELCLSKRGYKKVAALSTGLNAILGPPAEVLQLTTFMGARTDNSGLAIIEESKLASLPELKFTIGHNSYEHVIKPDKYVQLIEASGDLPRRYYVSIFPSMDDNEWLMGTIFFEHKYTIFDKRRHQVGFARLHGQTNDHNENDNDTDQISTLGCVTVERGEAIDTADASHRGSRGLSKSIVSANSQLDDVNMIELDI